MKFHIEQPISLFSIESLLNPDVKDSRWQDFEDFMENLKKDSEVQQRNRITKYWEAYESEDHPDKAIMTWVDSVALANAKMNVESDKEKKNNKSFNNLILKKKALYPTDFAMFDQLDKELPNFKAVTAFYRGSFALNQSRPISEFLAPRPILLLGNPGIGKTHYAKKIAKLLKTSYRFFDANSITGSWVLTGNNGSWKNADSGCIFKEMAKSETISPVILFDEIDKINAHRDQSPFSVFHQLFEKENARSFYDEFLDLNFDASQIIYILTANSINDIAPSLLSRMNVFHIENPDVEAMTGISQDIYKDLLGGSKLFKSKLADSEIEKLVKFTPREVTQIVSNNLYAQASSGFNKSSKTKSSLIINIDDKKSTQKIGFVR